MRRLGKKLDVQPSALYWHFPNKQALLGAIADQLVAGVLDACETPSSAVSETDTKPNETCDTPHQLRIALDLFTVMTATRSAAEVISAASATNTMDHNPARLLPQPVWHYVLGAALDFQTRVEAASALGIQSPALPKVEQTLSVLFAAEHSDEVSL